MRVMLRITQHRNGDRNMRLVLINMEIELLDRLLMDAARVASKSKHPDAYKVKRRIHGWIDKVREETSCNQRQSIS